MLMHGVPWQGAVTQGFVLTVVSGLLLLISGILGFFGWLPFLAVVLLLTALVIIVGLIPLFMNLSRSFFPLLFCCLLVHVLVTVLTGALYFRSTGIIDQTGALDRNFGNCFYFSLNTWTTLGASDFRVHPTLRLFSSCEALIGLATFAIALAILWLWCTENMIPKEQALFDGNRRHRKSLSVHRMRIRTITGKTKELGDDWVDPPRPGEAYTWDPGKEEWVVVTKESKLDEGTLALEREDRPNKASEADVHPDRKRSE
jgi:hypothetical protein